MSILQDYWNIPDPVRLNKVEDRPSNREASVPHVPLPDV